MSRWPVAGTLLERLQCDNITRLWVVYTDYSGLSHAKFVPPERFDDAIAHGIGFANANMDFNILDHQVPHPRLAANTGDFRAVPDPSTYALLPYAKGHARVFAYLHTPDEGRWQGCPRSALERIVHRYQQCGLAVQAAFEPECTLFARTPEGIVPADTSRMFSVEGLDRHLELMDSLVASLGAMGVVLEQVGAEYGPAQYEISVRHNEPMQAADDLLTLKETLKALARRAGLIASFMPKPFAEMPGCGLHVHLGLRRADGENALAGNAPSTLGSTGRSFVGGLLAHARGLCGIGAPTVNSYKRLLPGSWSPAHIVYGAGNRAALVRIPQGGALHVEFRAGDNTSNPHLFLAGLLAAGLDGIEGDLDPGDAVTGDIGHLCADEAAAQGISLLPRSARDALDAVEADTVLMDALGSVIGPAFLRVKRSELEAYELEVTDWERATYLETV